MKQLCPSPLKTSFMDCFVLLRTIRLRFHAMTEPWLRQLRRSVSSAAIQASSHPLSIYPFRVRRRGLYLGIGLLLGLSLSAVSPVHAADLANALNTGKVCEMLNGYIQATPGNEGEMSGLVSKVNDKRKLVYADIATREGIDPAIVGSENAAQEKAAHPEKFCQ